MFKKLSLSQNPQSSNPEQQSNQKPSSQQEPLSQSQNQPEENSNFQPSSNNEAPAHFDDLLEKEAQSEAQAQTIMPAGTLDKEAFHKVFVGVFGVASVLTHLQSLKIDGSDSSARAASDALYETIIDIPALHFLLEPQGKWAGRVMVIGMFAVPMALNVQAELASRTPKKAQAATPQANNAVVVPDFDMSGKNERP